MESTQKNYGLNNHDRKDRQPDTTDRHDHPEQYEEFVNDTPNRHPEKEEELEDDALYDDNNLEYDDLDEEDESEHEGRG